MSELSFDAMIFDVYCMFSYMSHWQGQGLQSEFG
jgi:hypothetical protein